MRKIWKKLLILNFLLLLILISLSPFNFTKSNALDLDRDFDTRNEPTTGLDEINRRFPEANVADINFDFYVIRADSLDVSVRIVNYGGDTYLRDFYLLLDGISVYHTIFWGPLGITTRVHSNNPPTPGWHTLTIRLSGMGRNAPDYYLDYVRLYNGNFIFINDGATAIESGSRSSSKVSIDVLAKAPGHIPYKPSDMSYGVSSLVLVAEVKNHGRFLAPAPSLLGISGGAYFILPYYTKISFYARIIDGTAHDGASWLETDHMEINLHENEIVYSWSVNASIGGSEKFASGGISVSYGESWSGNSKPNEKIPRGGGSGGYDKEWRYLGAVEHYWSGTPKNTETSMSVKDIIKYSNHNAELWRYHNIQFKIEVSTTFGLYHYWYISGWIHKNVKKLSISYIIGDGMNSGSDDSSVEEADCWITILPGEGNV